MNARSAGASVKNRNNNPLSPLLVSVHVRGDLVHRCLGFIAGEIAGCIR
jgi:hypothetical protein